MSTFTLRPNSNFAAPFSVPWTGRIRYEVESEASVTVMVLDPANLAAFRAGKPYTHYGSGITLPQIPYRQELTIPIRGQWYLVLVNFGMAPVAVHYLVWS